jgi:ADP-ribosylglycohydrolase
VAARPGVPAPPARSRHDLPERAGRRAPWDGSPASERVNHGGDSDSTGAICGNLLGASLGTGAIDADLLAGLEGRQVITQVADDLYDVFAEGREPSGQRYPSG